MLEKMWNDPLSRRVYAMQHLGFPGTQWRIIPWRPSMGPRPQPMAYLNNTSLPPLPPEIRRHIVRTKWWEAWREWLRNMYNRFVGDGTSYYGPGFRTDGYMAYPHDGNQQEFGSAQYMFGGWEGFPMFTEDPSEQSNPNASTS